MARRLSTRRRPAARGGCILIGDVRVRDGFALVALTMTTLACPGGRRAPPLESGQGSVGAASDVVARVAGRPILGGEIFREARRTGVPLRVALDARVRLELLALAAEEVRPAVAGQGQRPGDDSEDDREALQSAKVERLLESELEPRLRRAAITEGEIRGVYERARKRFVHGRLVQVAVLCVFTGARMKAEPRARAEAIARLLEEHVRIHPGTAADFETLSKDPDWMARNVSWTTVWQEWDEPFPTVVGQAVARLARPGDTTGLVGDETGYYIARYIAERPAENVSIAEARPRIEAEMLEPWRRQKFLKLTLEMARAHDIDVFPESFAALAPPSLLEHRTGRGAAAPER